MTKLAVIMLHGSQSCTGLALVLLVEIGVEPNIVEVICYLVVAICFDDEDSFVNKTVVGIYVTEFNTSNLFLKGIFESVLLWYDIQPMGRL